MEVMSEYSDESGSDNVQNISSHGCSTTQPKIDSEQKYMVLAPLAVRPHSEYVVVVILEDGDQDNPVHLELRQSSGQDVVRTYSQDVLVPANSSRVARLQVGELLPKDGGDISPITLVASGGEGSHRWKRSTQVLLETKTASILIQTDKAKYKPGQDVRIRVLALDPRLKPTLRQPLQVHVKDGHGNRIRQWLEEPSRLGIWSAVLRLSEQPVMGSWTVTASVPGSRPVSKKFAVEEYVLPTFEVSLQPPSRVAYTQGKVVVTVAAKYTYGKPVVGKATVKAKTCGSRDAVEKVVSIEGTATVEFDLKSDLGMASYEKFKRIYFEAWVTEELTACRRSAGDAAYTLVEKGDYVVEFLDSTSLHSRFWFTPGQPLVAKLKVTDIHGGPVRDDKITVSVVRFEVEDNNVKLSETVYEEELELPADGIASFRIETKETRSYLELTANYRGEAYRHCFHSSPSDQRDLSIKVTNACLKPGDDVEVHIKGKALHHVTALVVGPLGVDEVRTLALHGGDGDADGRKATLRFRATEAMAPASRVLVLGVKRSGELMADVAAFELTGFTPAVELRVEPGGSSEPGQRVSVRVTAEPNAAVALLAVDQSVLLLGGAEHAVNSGISPANLRAEMLSFETRAACRRFGTGANDLVRTSSDWCWMNKILADNVFKMAGMAYLTNTTVAVEKGRRKGGGGGGCIVHDPPGAGGPRLRTVFPETWIWQEIDSGPDGTVSLETTVPDSITSWVVSALAVDPVRGLGLSDTAKLTVFRPFFASLSLPYSVIRGESVEIPVLVFNYTDEATSATVTMDNSRGEFEFTKGGQSSAVTEVTVPAQGGASVSFNITANKVGTVMLRVTATTDKAGDALERPLRVKAEGETQYRNRAVPIDLREQKAFSTIVKLDMPGLVPDSGNIEVSAIGDVLGPTTANLDSLIRTPYGCGEQNMLNFVPNIVISTYLKRTGRSTPLVENKARSFSETGYQRELTYRHADGSFSAFGRKDASGSTWLTAFVAKSFALARAAALVEVDQAVVLEAMRWLAERQAPDGSFPEVGSVFHRDMQGGAAKGLALTAYVLTAFLQDQEYAAKHQATVEKTVKYLVENMDTLDDPYAVAITAYALHLADDPVKDKAFTLLDASATTEAGCRFWRKPVDRDNPYWGQPNSVNVEMTSYALMTYVSRGLLSEAVPIMQWLISQRNSNGGFPSTQDTVVGLQALASMAELISFPLGDMTVRFKHRGPGEARMAVNAETNLILQKEELPRHVREVEVAAEGSGFVLAQVSWSYNEDTVSQHPRFDLKVTVNDSNAAPNRLVLCVLSSFICGPWGTESNMAVIEVTLPSGFTADSDAMDAVRANERVRRAETKDQDSVIVMYFDKMEAAEYNVDVLAVRTHLVSNQKPVPVTVYDYYDQSRQARVFYEVS